MELSLLDNGYAYDLKTAPGNLTLLTATPDPSICRIVTDDQGNPLSVVKIQLQKPDGTVGAAMEFTAYSLRLSLLLMS